jgi:hypothetical protein
MGGSSGRNFYSGLIVGIATSPVLAVSIVQVEQGKGGVGALTLRNEIAALG